MYNRGQDEFEFLVLVKLQKNLHFLECLHFSKCFIFMLITSYCLLLDLNSHQLLSAGPPEPQRIM